MGKLVTYKLCENVNQFIHGFAYMACFHLLVYQQDLLFQLFLSTHLLSFRMHLRHLGDH